MNDVVNDPPKLEPGSDRPGALALLHEYTKNESLIKHALAVEACMRAYAKKLDPANEERWAITGLLHDFDYDQFPTPDEHPFVGEKILEDRKYPADIRRAILSHAEYSGVKRETPMEKALFACDELAGFLTACALGKPTRSIFEVEAASVKKKMKDKAFARSVSRDDITNGAADLGVPLEEHIGFCIQAMQASANELGLKGTAPKGEGSG
jgi:putative nucleotidyltransferase with HDIG domain